MGRRELDCTVSIGRQQGMSLGKPVTDKPVITLDITDATSSVRFLSIEIDAACFAVALTGMGFQPAKMEVRKLELVGRRRETKNENVLVPSGSYNNREEAARIAIAPFEKDGWKGSQEDAHNHYRVSHDHKLKVEKGDTVYKVSFVRYVDGDGHPVEAGGDDD